MRSAGRFAVGIIAVLMLVAAGCATVPSSGDPVDFAQVADPGTQVKDTTPEDGLGPLEIVRGFIAASARVDQDTKLNAARSYLTADAMKSWQAVPAGVMILSAVPRYDLAAETDDGVLLSSTTDGYLTPDGAYVPTPRMDFKVIVGVVQVDGQWRIQSPPNQLVLFVGDFNLAYTQREVYFIDHTGTLVVPDRRWLPNRSLYPVTMADQLLSKLISGPSDGLAKAVRNELTGVSLRVAIKAGTDGVLQVDLTGVPSLTTENARSFAAQVVYTLRSDAANIRILIDGAPLDIEQDVWTTGVLGSFDPDGVPGSGTPGAVGYYLNPDGAMVNLTGVPVWGTAGTGELQARSASMSAATGDVAIVGTTDSGMTLYVGSPVHQEPMAAKLTATSFTAPSFSRAGDELWTVINGATAPEVVRLAGSRYPVDSSALAGIGEITDLALSPDGVRVAVVAGQKLYLSTVVYADDPGTSGATESAQGVTATLTSPVQLRSELIVSRAIWSDSRNILITAVDVTSTYRTVWRIGMDGRVRTLQPTRGILADVDAVAATGALPTLISFGGRIYQLQGDESSGVWVSANPAGGPPAGSSPFYPA
jgi:hypothetical protein